jgi:type I restriction enzyme S subunit
MAAPNVEFVHYSIPAWDATGGPVIELGEKIESNKTAISAPSVLVSKLNPRKPRVVAVTNPVGRTCCSTEFICYQPRRSSDDLKFWAAYFASNDFSGRLARVAVGSTNSHTRAAPRETLKWPIPEVPTAEQNKLAQIFDTLDTAIHETEAIIAKLKAVKQGLLHDLLTRGIDANGELRPPQTEAPHLYKPTPLGWIPTEWSFGPLQTWLDGKPKNGYSPQEAGAWTGIQMLGLGCLSFDGFKPDQLKAAPLGDKRLQSALLSEGDLLMSRSNTRCLVGLVGVYRDVGTPCTYPDLMMRLRPSPETSAEFLQFVLLSSELRRQIQAHAVGTSGSMVKISGKIVSNLVVAIPPKSEQGLVLERLAALNSRLNIETDQIELLQQLKTGLMDDLLTGRVRVTHLLADEQQEGSI